jgi:hypothetical protein
LTVSVLRELPQGRKERQDMNARDMIVEAGFLAAKAGSEIIKEEGLTEKTLLITSRIDELALQLLKLAQEIKP